MNRSSVWLNGKIISADQFHLDPFGPGLQYGLGLFETTRVLNGLPLLWQQHLERLVQSALVLDLPVDVASLPTEDDVKNFAEGADDFILRLNLATCTDRDQPDVWMTRREASALGDSVRLALSPYEVSRTDPLSAIKCFNYGLRYLAHQRALAEGFDGALLESTDGKVLESSIANFFYRCDGQWFTPPLTGGVLPGTIRRYLLESPSFPITEQSLSSEDLGKVEEAFLTNSVRGIASVLSIGTHQLLRGAGTDLCQQLWRDLLGSR